MEVEVPDEIIVLGWTDVRSTTRQWLRGQATLLLQAQIAVDGTAVDIEQVRDLILRMTGPHRRHDALAHVETIGAHAADSLPEPRSISSAQSHCKPL